MLRQVYTSVATSGSTRNAYRDGQELVVRPDAQLPDICMHCGRPARGNVLHTKFPDSIFGGWWVLLPWPLEVIVGGLLLGRFQFEFPFCEFCLPDWSRIFPTRLDSHLGVFVVAARPFLDSLPPMPPSVAAEKNKTWWQRKLRRFYR
jgi:hypothetical protein